MGAHRYICILAHGPPPFANAEASHGCGRGSDGCVNPNHLRWATPKENNADKLLHGTTNRGTRCAHAKLSEREVLEIYSDARPIVIIAREYGVDRASIYGIKKGSNWGWLTNKNADGSASVTPA